MPERAIIHFNEADLASAVEQRAAHCRQDRQRHQIVKHTGRELLFFSKRFKKKRHHAEELCKIDYEVVSMHIVIGDSQPIYQPQKREADRGGALEAKVLAVRPPRRQAGEQPDGGERRREGGQTDPAGGKVLLLLAPEGHNVPADLDSGKYRVFLRIVPR